MISSNGIVTLPRVVDINLSVTFGKDFYVGECYGMRKRIAASQYRIQTDSVRLIYGDMMDFRIGFNNGAEYRFQTIYDGRKTSGSISTDVGDLSKWKTLLEKTEEERLECEKANAPSRIISTDEFQRTTLGFAQDACELYEEIPDIDQDYEHYSFVKKKKPILPITFSDTIIMIQKFMGPVIDAIRQGTNLESKWSHEQQEWIRA